MSITFDKRVNPEAAELIKQFFGQPVADDGRTFLFDRMNEIKQSEMKQVANSAKQVATVGIHDIGEIKEVGGVKYKVTPQGWVRI